MTAHQTEAALPPDDEFFATRSRAYELADTGRFKNWSHIAYTLLVERFAPLMIKRLDDDRLAVMMISRICRTRYVAATSPAGQIRKWFGMLRDGLS
jgi:hypothetical protein